MHTHAPGSYESYGTEDGTEVHAYRTAGTSVEFGAWAMGSAFITPAALPVSVSKDLVQTWQACGPM